MDQVSVAKSKFMLIQSSWEYQTWHRLQSEAGDTVITGILLSLTRMSELKQNVFWVKIPMKIQHAGLYFYIRVGSLYSTLESTFTLEVGT